MNAVAWKNALLSLTLYHAVLNPIIIILLSRKIRQTVINMCPGARSHILHDTPTIAYGTDYWRRRRRPPRMPLTLAHMGASQGMHRRRIDSDYGEQVAPMQDGNSQTPLYKACVEHDNIAL